MWGTPVDGNQMLIHFGVQCSVAPETLARRDESASSGPRTRNDVSSRQ